MWENAQASQKALIFPDFRPKCILHFDKIKLEGGSLLIGIFINSNQRGGWVMILYIGGGGTNAPFKRLQRQKNAL